MIKKEYNYDSMYMKPKKTQVDSRSECDTSVVLGKHRFKMPVIPANMMSVVDENTCKYLARRGYFYVMHRFNVDQISFIETMKNLELISSISIGVNKDSYEQLEELKKINLIPDFMTLDIAHAWCPKGERMIKYVKDNFPDTFLIAGNVASAEAVVDLEAWGADATKIFVGPGCFIAGTKVKTQNGYKNIEEIQRGDEVLTHKGRFKKVLGTLNRMEEDRLITINNKITSTLQHEFYVIKKEHKKLVNENNLEEYAFWVEAKDLTKDLLLIKYK